ncbi:hypothetical protein, partial [Mycobacterium sp.]|uniref:hypothetical protein n=1 Tax=Mycobacterium sp. TaxID=1785 RepID=UPI0025DEB75C
MHLGVSKSKVTDVLGITRSEDLQQIDVAAIPNGGHSTMRVCAGDERAYADYRRVLRRKGSAMVQPI